MNSKTIFVISMVVLFALPALTFAGHHQGSGHCMMSSWDMNELDTDNDREISFEEYVQPHNDKMRTGFNMIDANQDGVINESEWSELLKAHGIGSDQ